MSNETELVVESSPTDDTTDSPPKKKRPARASRKKARVATGKNVGNDAATHEEDAAPASLEALIDDTAAEMNAGDAVLDSDAGAGAATNTDTDESQAAPEDALADSPAPVHAVRTFASLELEPEILRALDEMGYENPMPVQLAVYDQMIAGKDIMVQSRTGSGKTAGFGIPIISQIPAGSTGAQALILAPTRELALQVSRELGRIALHKDLSVVPIYGGAPMRPQVEALRDGAQIIAGTPGRVLDHLRRKTLFADGIRVFVLDECDEMLSMGFQEEIEKIVGFLPPREERQTVLFSATIPDEIQRIARRHMVEPEEISLSDDGIGVAEIEHYYYVVTGMARTRDLLKVIKIENPESAIIFCNTREDTGLVARFMKQSGYDAEPISGDLTQNERERVMARMRAGNLRFLVGTDVAARGIDISDLSHVINYTFPESPEVYIHRTGRTGRAGKSGVAISLVGPRELSSFYYLKLMYKIRPRERDLPSSEEMSALLEGERYGEILRKIERDPDSEYRTLARRIWQSREGERIVGYLLQEFLSQAGEAQPRDTQAARESARDEQPERGRSEAREERRPQREEERGEGRRGRPEAREERRPRRREERGEGREERRPRREEGREEGRQSREERRPQREEERGEGREEGRRSREERRPRREEERGEGREEGRRSREERRPRREEGRRTRDGEDREERRPGRTEDTPTAERPSTREPREELVAVTETETREERAKPETREERAKQEREEREERPERAASTREERREERLAAREERRDRRHRRREERGRDGQRRGDAPGEAPARESKRDMGEKGEPSVYDPANPDYRAFWEVWADDKVAARDDSEAPSDNDNDPVTGTAESTRLFVNLGKRENISAAEIRALLGDGLGDDADRIGSIALRSNHCYVRVPEDLADRVIDLASGKSFQDRELLVERARR